MTTDTTLQFAMSADPGGAAVLHVRGEADLATLFPRQDHAPFPAAWTNRARTTRPEPLPTAA
jgi:hypothetical protein